MVATISRPTEPMLRPVSFSMIEIACVPWSTRPAVEQVAAHHAEQAVAELLVVHEELLLRVVEQLDDRAVDGLEPGHELVVRAERNVHRREPGFVVRVEVVRRVEQRHDVREAVHRQPDQLFLAPHLAVIARESARAARRRRAGP